MQKFFKKILNKKSFTMVELIVVISIIGILTAILVPTLSNMIENSKESVLEANSRGLVSFIKACSIKFDKEHMFKNSRDSQSPDYESRTYLSQYIEEYFEEAGYGETNFNLINPYSKKTGILNYSNYKLNEPYNQQAVVISNNSDLKYSSTNLSPVNGQKYLQGSIIIYMANGSDVIEIYYIDKDGKKSEIMWGT